MNIEALCRIARSPERKIIGLMSGTSFDGLDIALCAFTGNGKGTRGKLLHFKTAAYSSDFKEELKSVFSKKQADLEKITLLHAFIGTYFGQIVLDCLRSWKTAPEEVDLIASHGQTIFHAPRRLHGRSRYGNATLQIGDGDHLACTTGIITISDFRQKHIAAGGEGAPLAMYGDYLMCADDAETRIMLNIGGIANFSFLPAGKNAKLVFSTDTGPGNTLIDQFIQWKYPGTYYDQDAARARSGNLSKPLLEALMDHPFFRAGFPKTTGPELFNLAYLHAAQQRTGTGSLSNEDVLATLTMFSAETIARAIKAALPGENDPFRIYLSGGGIHNPLLIRHLETHFNGRLASTADLGIDPDAKEAVLFALLANEAVGGGRINYGDRLHLPSISMGKVSFPE